MISAAHLPPVEAKLLWESRRRVDHSSELILRHLIIIDY